MLKDNFYFIAFFVNLSFKLKMKDKGIDIEKLIKHWTESSDRDYLTMMDLYKTKHFHWSLFIGHLVI